MLLKDLEHAEELFESNGPQLKAVENSGHHE